MYVYSCVGCLIVDECSEAEVKQAPKPCTWNPELSRHAEKPSKAGVVVVAVAVVVVVR